MLLYTFLHSIIYSLCIDQFYAAAALLSGVHAGSGTSANGLLNGSTSGVCMPLSLPVTSTPSTGLIGGLIGGTPSASSSPLSSCPPSVTSTSSSTLGFTVPLGIGPVVHVGLNNSASPTPAGIATSGSSGIITSSALVNCGSPSSAISIGSNNEQGVAAAAAAAAAAVAAAASGGYIDYNTHYSAGIDPTSGKESSK
ncbi:unnamed protein product [Protopolystoma xenopodis]|uniref:Uncharacterized protein n=1 Tax=Protopolystoma xenopodis TaxID=117903 RepID=A0A3S5FFM1_9PLAT|nr:unnamed protein product [Protopolystoma xenopodis]